MNPNYDRKRQDLGNIVLLEHVNVTIPDQRLATIFYLSGLGLTRDPYLMAGIDNMWVNVGRNQFHLPSRGTQVLRGHVGVVVPDLAALKRRLQKVAPLLTETRFAWEERDGAIEATCPWGNRYRCHAPAPEFGATELAIAYVEFGVPPGSAAGIARFYEQIMGAHVELRAGAARPRARSRSTTGIMSRSTSAIFPGRTGACLSGDSSRRRATSISTASATSSTRLTEALYSRLNTRSGASLTRSTPAPS
jgi:hypothetical protein